MNNLYVNNTGTDLRSFHGTIVAAINNGGELPEELADLFSLVNLGPINDDGSNRYLVNFI